MPFAPYDHVVIHLMLRTGFSFAFPAAADASGIGRQGFTFGGQSASNTRLTTATLLVMMHCPAVARATESVRLC